METEQVSTKPFSTWKIRALMAAVPIVGLVASASAAVDINATIGPLLDQLVTLIPSIINLVVALVPAIVIMSVVGFIVAFLDRILGMMKL
jgi:hypothetical protein